MLVAHSELMDCYYVVQCTLMLFKNLGGTTEHPERVLHALVGLLCCLLFSLLGLFARSILGCLVLTGVWLIGFAMGVGTIGSQSSALVSTVMRSSLTGSEGICHV